MTEFTWVIGRGDDEDVKAGDLFLIKQSRTVHILIGKKWRCFTFWSIEESLGCLIWWLDRSWELVGGIGQGPFLAQYWYLGRPVCHRGTGGFVPDQTVKNSPYFDRKKSGDVLRFGPLRRAWAV
mmetsp:Transcript_38962/g.154185  ORF Transcript_38962/g.154185 Transcript_38962/m.154185 type:complete len:124 (+) Transcript_38962:143-514(+)